MRSLDIRDDAELLGPDDVLTPGGLVDRSTATGAHPMLGNETRYSPLEAWVFAGLLYVTAAAAA